MCLENKQVQTKHKPYTVLQALSTKEQFTGPNMYREGKKGPYLVHFKNIPNTHLGNVQKPPKRRLGRQFAC